MPLLVFLLPLLVLPFNPEFGYQFFPVGVDCADDEVRCRTNDQTNKVYLWSKWNYTDDVDEVRCSSVLWANKNY